MMKKRLIALLIALAVCLLPAMAVYAEAADDLLAVGQEQPNTYVNASLSEEDAEVLNAQAAAIYANYGVEAYFTVCNDGSVSNAAEYAINYSENAVSSSDSIVLALTDSEWYIYTSGRTANIFSDEDRMAMWNAFLAGEGDYGAISGYFSEVERQLAEKGVHIVPSSRLLPRLVDGADLLSDSDEAALLAHLDEISERQQFDVVVVTVDSLDGRSPMEYADDFYDYNGYGFGENHDGAILLISMEERDYWISTTGYGIYALTDAGIDYISEQFVPYLSSGDYLNGFTCYADLTDEFVTQAKSGEPYDTNNLNDGLSPVWIPVSLGGGALAGRIPLANMKRKLRSVRKQSGATNYMRKNSLSLRENNDNFLYSNVKRRYIEPVRSSSGGGSSTHFGSSGTSHGGGGGKF